MTMTDQYKCDSCGAKLTIDENELIIKCNFCGAQRNVPNYEQRKRLLMEQERLRLDQLHQQKRFEEEMLEKQEDRQEQKENKKRERRFWALHRLWMLVPLLLVPGLILSQVFNIYPRYFGPTGRESLQITVDQLKSTGCTIIKDITTLYTENVIVETVSPSALPCIHVLAHDGSTTGGLKGRFFNPNGKIESEVGFPEQHLDLSACNLNKELVYRYEINPGIIHNSRLSYAVMACPERPKEKKKSFFDN